MADPLSITVNGRERPVAASPDTPLLYVLTDELELHGPRFGCGLAQCGSCSVLADGVEIRSCVTPVAAVANKAITTLEGLPAWYAEQKGLSSPPAFHPLQQAFIDHDAFQCGSCTSGQLCSAAGLIAEGRANTVEEIRELMSGNLCRCGAYPNIVAAIRQAMERERT
jgi:aerobic-type carbon monoxide dehydrogenase small subunit (CoxS/CutS family)